MDHVTAIVERERGSAPDDVVCLGEGGIKESYVVTLEDERFVLQLDAPEEAGSLRRCLGCYRLLRETPVPVPQVVASGEQAGRTYGLVEHLPGESAELDVSPERAQEAGDQLARIHEARAFEHVGELRFGENAVTVEPFEASHAGRLSHEVVEWAESLRDAGLGAAVDDVERLLTERASRLPEPDEYVLCHGDFSPDNVLFRGTPVTGVVDFDVAFAGPAALDLSRAANAFWLHEPGADWDPRERLYAGYRERRGVPSNFDRWEPLYRIAALTRGVAGLAEHRGLSSEEVSFYTEAAEAAVDRAETRQ